VKWKNVMWSLVVLCMALAVMAFPYARASRAARMPAASSTSVTNGKIIYGQKCAACHFDTSSEKKIGPGLAGLMKRPRFKNGMTANDNNLRRVIERGGKDMPGFQDSLKQKQIRDLIAYVKTL
jgi:mono/diheme cytochrome c family protein